MRNRALNQRGIYRVSGVQLPNYPKSAGGNRQGNFSSGPSKMLQFLAFRDPCNSLPAPANKNNNSCMRSRVDSMSILCSARHSDEISACRGSPRRSTCLINSNQQRIWRAKLHTRCQLSGKGHRSNTIFFLDAGKSANANCSKTSLLAGQRPVKKHSTWSASSIRIARRYRSLVMSGRFRERRPAVVGPRPAGCSSRNRSFGCSALELSSIDRDRPESVSPARL
jgi:hypothetical protein